MMPVPIPAMTLADAQEADCCRFCAQLLNIGQETPIREEGESSHASCLLAYCEGLAEEEERRDFYRSEKWNR